VENSLKKRTNTKKKMYRYLKFFFLNNNINIYYEFIKVNIFK